MEIAIAPAMMSQGCAIPRTLARNLDQGNPPLDSPRLFFLCSEMRLSDYPYVIVRIGCRKCSRRGQYRLARLADRYGSEMTLLQLLEHLSADCKLRQREGRSLNLYERCGAYFVDLCGSPRPPDVPYAMRPKLKVAAK